MNLQEWLLDGDIAIQYQVKRDLLNMDDFSLREQIINEGFGARLLSLQQEDGHWGGGYYRKKWISTHYTLLELRRLNCPQTSQIETAIQAILNEYLVEDTWRIRDICMNGMLLNVFCYYMTDQSSLKEMIDYIVTQQLKDGGFNCEFKYKDKVVHHSSLHSTLSMIEGFNQYIINGYSYRVEEIKRLRQESVEFILQHRLYKSDKSGEIIKKSFTMLSFPPRWKFDILRCLDAFVEASIPYDERMEDALEILIKKQRKDGTWPLQQKYSGSVHFDMEQPGHSSRINTLRVLRVFKAYKPQLFQEIMSQ